MPVQFPLVPGYTVYVTQPQVDEVVDSSGGSATKMMQNPLMVFFTPNVLAKSSCFGSRKFPGLQKDIVTACLSKYLCNSQCRLLLFYKIYHFPQSL